MQNTIRSILTPECVLLLKIRFSSSSKIIFVTELYFREISLSTGQTVNFAVLRWLSTFLQSLLLNEVATKQAIPAKVDLLQEARNLLNS
jgi:hypothetical protein